MLVGLIEVTSVVDEAYMGGGIEIEARLDFHSALKRIMKEQKSFQDPLFGNRIRCKVLLPSPSGGERRMSDVLESAQLRHSLQNQICA